MPAPPAPTPPRSRDRKPRCRRSSIRPESSAPTPSRSSWTSRPCSPPSRFRRGAASRCSRTPAGSGSWRRTRARRRDSSSHRSPTRPAKRCRALLPSEASLANPVDMLGSATDETFEAVLPHIVRDPGIDSVIVLFVPPVVANAEDVAAAVVRAVEAAAVSEKPVLGAFVSHGGTPTALVQERRVTAFPYPESAARALGRVVERAEWLRRPVGRVPELGGIDHAEAEALVRTALGDSGEAWLTPAQVRELLGAYGISFVAEHLAETSDAAVAAAETLGYPGGGEDRRARSAQDGEGPARARPPERCRGSRSREAHRPAGRGAADAPKGGAELLAGVVQDPVFGPLVAFGPGGVLAELIGDAAFRIAPLTDVDALELVTTREGGPPRRGLPRCAAVRRGGARRPRPPALPLGRRSARGRGARPQSGARASERLCRGRRPDPPAHAPARAAHEGLVGRRARPRRLPADAGRRTSRSRPPSAAPPMMLPIVTGMRLAAKKLPQVRSAKSAAWSCDASRRRPVRVHEDPEGDEVHVGHAVLEARPPRRRSSAG